MSTSNTMHPTTSNSERLSRWTKVAYAILVAQRYPITRQRYAEIHRKLVARRLRSKARVADVRVLGHSED